MESEIWIEAIGNGCVRFFLFLCCDNVKKKEMGRSASYSALLFDAEEKKSGQTGNDVEPVNLHRSNDVVPEEFQQLYEPPVHRFRKLSSSTIYSLSLLLIVTVFAWAILDCRARVFKLEQALRYMYYRQHRMH